ncbi:MAG: autotransporter outer membrane beta-barrel domain-containing protein [Pseudorhodoplanes sp.]|nr:autotransporter outer membrane beta-barrel domain-containing protein [Pseudorhodoplanes sp.]
MNVFNAGTISGYIGVMAGLGGGSVLVNAGRIVGTFAAIDFTASGGDTLTFLPGSRLVGSVELGNGNGASTVNIVTGRDVGWLVTFGACGCGGLIENQSIVRFSGGAPAVVSGNQIATLDPTAFGLADRNLVDFTGWISSLFSGRLGETGPANAAFAAYAPPANPASAVARDAFASARPADAQEAPARVFCRTPSRSIRDRERRSGPRVFAGIRRQDADGPMLAATTTGYGGAFGIDGLAAPDLRVGGFIGAGAGRFGVDRDSQHIETDYVFGGVYGRLDRAAHYLDFAVSAGHSVSDSRRLVANNMAVNGLETALGKYDGWFVSPEVAYGVRVPVGANVTLVPNARVRYVMGHFDGYAETGSAQSLSVGRRDMHDIEERLSLR